MHVLRDVRQLFNFIEVTVFLFDGNATYMYKQYLFYKQLYMVISINSWCGLAPNKAKLSVLLICHFLNCTILLHGEYSMSVNT